LGAFAFAPWLLASTAGADKTAAAVKASAAAEKRSDERRETRD
jgi:hypothetical protein